MTTTTRCDREREEQARKYRGEDSQTYRLNRNPAPPPKNDKIVSGRSQLLFDSMCSTEKEGEKGGRV